MKLSFEILSPEHAAADSIAFFLPSDDARLARARKAIAGIFGAAVEPAFDSKDFKGAETDLVHVYLPASGKVRRLFLVGLGEHKKAGLETYRRAAGRAARRFRDLKVHAASCVLPDSPEPEATLAAMAEGAILSLYRFDKYKSASNDKRRGPESIAFISEERALAKKGSRVLERAVATAEAACFARDLANAPGNEIYPETLAAAAIRSGKRHGYKVRVYDRTAIEKLGMGGVIGVAQGSARPPRFIVMEYGTRGKPVVLVGKGVTFDTGGISIKPSTNMAEMKMDMSGAAAVIATMEAVARLRLAVRVVGLVPAVENMPSGQSIRPGDILRHYNGKTSEVDNTDAEGRLILADALGYAERFKPAAVIDLATLTGACVVALGHYATGMMGTDEGLMRRLKESGDRTYERVWQLPLFDEYEKLIKSDVADVKNVGGRWAGAITAAWFLRKFIGDYPWVHLDIAGTAMLEENGDYTQRGASGVGVRLLVDFLSHWK